MNLNEYKLSKTQREDSLRSIIDPKNDWKVPAQNPYLNPNNPLQENFYGGEPLVQAEPVAEQEPAEEEAEEYEVEQILEKKVKQGKVFYLVKWRGYPVEEATWEPRANLLHAPLKIKDFESQAYDPLGEAANLKKSKKNPEAESKNKLKSPEPTSILKTPNMEAALPNQPTMIPNPYMPTTLASKPATETMGVFMSKEVGNENNNKKKATSNGDVPDKSSAYPKGQKKGNMEEELVRKDGNISQDEINGNRAMTTQRELIQPNGNKEMHPYEKIKNASPEEKEDAVVKMRKLNSDTRELNLLRAEGETLLTSPADLGKMLVRDEKAAQFRDLQQPALLNKDIAMLQATANMFPSYNQMLKNSSSLQTGLTQFQNDAEYQRLANGDTNAKHVAATTFDPSKGANPPAAKTVQNQKPSSEEHNNSQQRTTTKLKKKGPGEPGSFEKGDVPLKVMGIRPMPEINDLEILIDWKAREDGTKPYNSKVRRVDLLKHGHFMPLIEFYESKMRLETAPNFDPKLLTKY